VCLKLSSTASYSSIEEQLQRHFSSVSEWELGQYSIERLSNIDIQHHIEHIQISLPDEGVSANGIESGKFLDVEPRMHVFQLSEEGAVEDDEGEDGVPSFREWILPCRELHQLWDSLCYEQDVKGRLLSFARSALVFSRMGVNTNLISWNRVVLLHGPPGTGKTSLCKAMAQKLAERLSTTYSMSQLVEVNAHSLFSKWFSESGKLVSRLFSRITEMVEDDQNLVFVLIDEVESLTSARKAAVTGSEPSDAVRAVNALLTQLDMLKSRPNVMVLCTSNLSEAIDVAFIDRADIKCYVGPPVLSARYQILLSCIQELRRVGMIRDEEQDLPPPWDILRRRRAASSSTTGQGDAAMECTPSPSQLAAVAGGETWAAGAALLGLCEAAEGLSGRALRKLPFLAHARRGGRLCRPMRCQTFLCMLWEAVEAELEDRRLMDLR